MASCLSTISESHDRKQNMLTYRRHRSALAPGGGGFSRDSAPLMEQLNTEPGEPSRTGRTWRICDSSFFFFFFKKDKIHLLIVPVVAISFYLVILPFLTASLVWWRFVWGNNWSVSLKESRYQRTSSRLSVVWCINENMRIWDMKQKKREREKEGTRGRQWGLIFNRVFILSFCSTLT